MPVTTDELTYARSFIGNKETEAVFAERMDRLSVSGADRGEVLNSAIEESLRAQLAVLTLDQPSSASVGSVSYSQGANIQALQKTLQEFRVGLAQGGVQRARLVRARER